MEPEGDLKAGFGADRRGGETPEIGIPITLMDSGYWVSASSVLNRSFRNGGTGKSVLRSQPNKSFKWDADSRAFLRIDCGAPRPLILSLGVEVAGFGWAGKVLKAGI